MLYASATLVGETLSQLITLGGVELTNSRRYVDLAGVEAMRWQYKATNALDVRIDYSLDDGTSWNMLADEYGTTGTGPVVTTWVVIPDEARVPKVLLRAYSTGSGLLTSVNFVQVDFR